MHEVQRCDLCARFDGDEAAIRVARGAGLDVTEAGVATPADAARWRASYAVIRPPSGRRRPRSEDGLPAEISPGEIARALAYQPTPHDPAPGVVWLEHRHDGTPSHAAFDWWVRDHGRDLCFAVVVYRNRHAESDG